MQNRCDRAMHLWCIAQAPDRSGCKRDARSGFFVLLDIEAHLAFGALATLVGLFPVLGLDLGGLEGVVHNSGLAAAGAADGHAGYQHVSQFDLAVLDLAATGLAQRDFYFAKVLTCCAVLEHSGVALVHFGDHVQVLEGNLTNTSTATRGHAVGLNGAPGERVNVCPACVVGVFGLAAGTFYLHKHVY